MGEKYDFSGWATKNDLKCSDGRVIRRNAFADQDGQVVPLVWQHMHDSPENVLGHALLENREDGVYTYCSFNKTPLGQNAKMLVEHGDISDLSIHANKLKQMGSDVLHGTIREVSLVLAGANPGAHIEYPVLAHGEESETEAIIYTGEGIDAKEGEVEMQRNEELSHKDGGETLEDIFNTLSEKQKNAVYAIISQVMDGEGMEHSDNEDDDELEHSEDGESLEDVFETLTDKQKDAVYSIVSELIDEEDEDDDDDDEDDEEDGETEEDEDIEHSDDEEDEPTMKKNVFEGAETAKGNVLTHSDMESIFKRAKGLGSLREAVNEFTDNQGVALMHGDTPSYGIQQLPSKYSDETYGIDMLFPEYRADRPEPEFISRNMEWVNALMGGVSHSPFTRIKSMFADITEDEARAKGYAKGKKKMEEVFTLLKRTTDPQTIYKKQKLDRDDILDITDFDVVAWLKREMRVMLNEEIARAILIGDGRNPSSDDKIQDIHVRPIATDDDLFTVKVKTTADPKQQIKDIIRARKNYKGSGSPIMFTTEDILTEMLLIEDGMERSVYKTEQELATKLRVSRIVPVEVMEGQKIGENDIYAVIVNPRDYRVGTDKGGEINLFDDFDIDYNQQKYLMETRISGALVKPFSAMVVTSGGSASTNTSEEPTENPDEEPAG